MWEGIARRTLQPLTRPGTGVVFALLSATLCALGGVVLELVPNFYRYRLWHSWSAPRWHTVWLVVLVTVVVLWCVHAGLRLHDLARARVSRSRWALHVALVQAGLALALGAYVWLFVCPPPEEFVVTDKGADIHGEFYRVLRVEPGNREQERRTAVWLEKRQGSASSEIRVERGSCWSSEAESHQLVLARAQLTTDGAILRRGGRRVDLPTAKPMEDGKDTLLFPGFRHHRHERSARVPHAEVKSHTQKTSLPLDPEWAGENAFLGLKESPVCLLRVHRSIGTQLATIATALLLGAMLLIWQARTTSGSGR